MTSPPLRIALLGPPVHYWSGEILRISRRQVRAVLYRLAADFRPMPREQLCALIWPEEPLPEARRNLSHLLTHLRLSLPEADLLDYTSETVALNPERTWCDTQALEQIYVVRHRLLQVKPGADDEWRQSLDAVENVIRAYRGPFLSGFSLRDSQEFEAWVGHERQYYECRFLEILFDLIDYYQQRKDYPNAITHATRYLDIDNLAEEVHCKLIELYASVGDRSAAERQFERCATALEQDLGISPSPKTWAMYQSAIGPKPPGLPISTQGLAIKSIKDADTPFVGRTELLKAIDLAFNLAGSGRGRVILVSGEPGSGKSRLLQQIAAHYHCNGTVLYSVCSPGLSDLPYHPIAEAFRPVVESQSLNVKVSPLWLAEVARLLPEIYARYPDLPAPLPVRPEEARRRLFEALSQLAGSLETRFHPLLLCLDDLQWADAATLEWLIYLANRLASQGLGHLLILGAFRSDQAASLGELRTALNRLGLLEEHHLPGFETKEVEEILRHRLGNSEDHQDLAIQLHQAAGGNPFLVLETLRALIDTHMIPGKLPNLNNLPLPKAVQETVRQSLTPLNNIEHQLLVYLSVLSLPCTMEMVLEGEIASSEMEILEGLDSLVFRGLLREQHSAYCISYDLVRLVIYHDLSYSRRKLLHRKCAKLFEKFRPDEIALLAWHFEQSGEPGKAAAYALRAGENSVLALDFPEALDFFSRALDLFKQQAINLTTPDEIAANYRQQSMALNRRGSVFRSMGEMQSYQDDIEEEARLATALGDQSALAMVLLREANVHRWFCRYPQARECAEKALDLGLRIENVLIQAGALREIGLAARAVGDFSKARGILEDTLRLFQEQENVGYEIHTLCDLSSLATYLGDFSRAEKWAHQALARCEQAQMTDLRHLPLGDLGVALAASGRIEQGKECLLTSLDLAREIADRTQEIFCLYHLGRLENGAGQPNAGLGFLRNGLALAERLDSRSEQSRLYAGLAEAHRLLGNARLARGFAIKALSLARQHGRRHDQSWAEQILAKIDRVL